MGRLKIEQDAGANPLRSVPHLERWAEMKPANLIKPAWCYFVAATPLAAACFLSWRFLEAESYKYTFGTLRNISVLLAVQLPQLMGVLALLGFVLFGGSAFSKKCHDIAIQKTFISAALLLYGFWSFPMTRSGFKSLN
jgi:hypothetical protein